MTTYSYDALGNLRAVVLPDGREISYTVDGENHRIWKTVDGVRVQGFLWRGALQVVAELDGAGNVISRFVFGDQAANVPDYMVRAGSTYRILKDHLGSPRLVVDAASGLVVQWMDYDEFGRVLVDTNSGWQSFGFAGGLWDADTGLVRFGARDYDAETGRWTSKDPIRFEGGDTNIYLYSQGDPINKTDPAGLLVGAECGQSLRKGCEEGCANTCGGARDRVCVGMCRGFAQSIEESSPGTYCAIKSRASCDRQYSSDSATYGGLDDAGQRARCWASAAARLGACYAGQPLPPLAIW